jgi:hypothetical protein
VGAVVAKVQIAHVRRADLHERKRLLVVTLFGEAHLHSVWSRRNKKKEIFDEEQETKIKEFKTQQQSNFRSRTLAQIPMQKKKTSSDNSHEDKKSSFPDIHIRACTCMFH